MLCVAASERFHTFHFNQRLVCFAAPSHCKQPEADSCWYICDGLQTNELLYRDVSLPTEHSAAGRIIADCGSMASLCQYL